MIPAELHSRVRAAREQAGVTLSAYITQLLTNYYKGGNEKMAERMRTMAFQMPEEMFQRLKEHAVWCLDAMEAIGNPEDGP